MGDGRGKTAGSGKLLDLQHAPFDFQLFHAAERRQVAQNADGKSHLATLVINLS